MPNVGGIPGQENNGPSGGMTTTSPLPDEQGPGLIFSDGGGISKGGKLTVGEGDFSASERSAAQYMADLGNDVFLRAPSGTRAEGGRLIYS